MITLWKSAFWIFVSNLLRILAFWWVPDKFEYIKKGFLFIPQICNIYLFQIWILILISKIWRIWENMRMKSKIHARFPVLKQSRALQIQVKRCNSNEGQIISFSVTSCILSCPGMAISGLELGNKKNWENLCSFNKDDPSRRNYFNLWNIIFIDKSTCHVTKTCIIYFSNFNIILSYEMVIVVKERMKECLIDGVVV